MFEPNSRYVAVETATYTAADGRTIAYKRRRFLPQREDQELMAEVTVSQDDRLDLIAARTLGDPEQFWRICDANEAMHPDDLTARAGRTLGIPVPRAVSPS